MSDLREDAFVSVEQMQNEVVRRAVEDEEFRANLLADPKSAINDEFGIQLPEIIEVSVHESKGTSLHLALPPDGAVFSDEELEAAAGGYHGGELPHLM